MKFFPTSDIKLLDEYTIRHEPIASIDLMERAATAVCQWLQRKVSKHQRLLVCCGNGNNGGDGLAVARIMAQQGYNVEVWLLTKPEDLSPDALTSYQRLDKQLHIHWLYEALPTLTANDVVIDALFGSGLNRPLSGLAADVVRHINSNNAATVISIDMPSGLFGEDNSTNSRTTIVKARYTLSLELPKLSFLFPENEELVGEMVLIPIGLHPQAIHETPSSYHYLTLHDVRPLLPKRNHFAHKGSCGHCLLVAGAYGMTGAAILAARACYRSGVGLLTVHTPANSVPILQTAIPEAILSVDANSSYHTTIPQGRYTAVAIGPGLGTHPQTAELLFNLLEQSEIPVVVDADALNLLAAHPDKLELLPPFSILTPHPKEFERLAGTWSNDFERLQLLQRFAKKHHVIVVLKGAYTTIALPSGTLWFNSTGNPGMATAGSGDVLTGIILALTGQGLTYENAALAGVYVHGLAGDVAADMLGELSLTASDIIDYLPQAFKRSSMGV